MAFTILNTADTFHASQADPDKVDFDILVAGLAGDGVISGCAVTAQGSPDMTCAVAVGVVRIGGTWAAVTAGNVTITTADATNPRYDLVVVSNAGTKSVTAGTAAATPVFPSIPASSIVLAAVYVPASDTTIATNQITDKRVLVSPIGVMNQSMTQAGPDNTTSETTLYSFSVPANALGATGALRCKIYGQFRPNTAAATFTIRVKFGATTMWADVTASRAIDTDIAAFEIEFVLANTATNAQRLGGYCHLGQTIAATNGFGDMSLADGAAGNLSNSTPFYGTAAIDTTAAATLDVTAQLSAAGASNQCLKQMAILERIV